MAEEEISEDSGYQTGVPPEFDGPEPMDESDVDAYVGHLLEDAIDYIDELSEDRITSTEYYSGHLPKQDEDGRSSVVSYDVRDTVNSIMPVLMRTFFGSKQIMQFTPRGPEDVEMAQQATDYINHIILEENQNSFSHFYAAFKDCLIKRTGILKYWYEKTENVSTSKYTGLDEAQVQTLAGADGVEGVDAYQREGEGGQPLYDVIIKRRTNDGRIRVEALPPEEFIIDRRAKNVDEATVVGHRCYKTLSELQALGHDIEELEEYAGTDDEFDVIGAHILNEAVEDVHIALDVADDRDTQRAILLRWTMGFTDVTTQESTSLVITDLACIIRQTLCATGAGPGLSHSFGHQRVGGMPTRTGR